MAQYIYTMNRVGKVVPPKRTILRDISLSFFPGAKIGVLGLNGSGKSSLLRIMAAVDTNFDVQLATTRDFVAIPSTRGAEGWLPTPQSRCEQAAPEPGIGATCGYAKTHKPAAGPLRTSAPARSRSCAEAATARVGSARRPL